MPYIRVKSDLTGHEFDVHPGRVSAHPEWTVVDPEPVSKQRPPKHGKPKRGNKVVNTSLTTLTPIDEAPLEDGVTEEDIARMAGETRPVNDERLSKRSAPSGD